MTNVKKQNVKSGEKQKLTPPPNPNEARTPKVLAGAMWNVARVQPMNRANRKMIFILLLGFVLI